MIRNRKNILVFFLITAFAVAIGAVAKAPAALADSVGPITFATAADYSNNFRDVLNGGNINQGLDLSGTGHTALNFTGSYNNASFAGAIAVYDSNPSNGSPTLWTGNSRLSADIIIDPFNNAKGAGLLTLFNEGSGMQGLALFLWDAGNSDGYSVNLVHQDGVSRPGNTLASVGLGSNIPEDRWFRLTLDLAFTGSNFTATGKVFSHATVTDPNSATSQVGGTLSYTGALSSVLTDPYEVGLVSRGDSAVANTSVTNFSIDGTPIDGDGSASVPEPGTLLLLTSGLLAIGARARWALRKHDGKLV